IGLAVNHISSRSFFLLIILGGLFKKRLSRPSAPASSRLIPRDRAEIFDQTTAGQNSALAPFSDRARLSRERAARPSRPLAKKSQSCFSHLQGWPRRCERRTRNPAESE